MRLGKSLLCAVTVVHLLKALPVFAAGVEMNVSDAKIEIRGEGWRLRYGTTTYAKPQLVIGESGLVWFSHLDWLRLIDERKGVVVGRWHFPGDIVSVTPKGDRLEVELELLAWTSTLLHPKITVNPRAEKVPYWPRRLGEYEANGLSGDILSYRDDPSHVSIQQAKDLVPELEQMAQRDPLTPSLKVALGALLKRTGDPRAASVFREAAETPVSIFYESFEISSHLDHFGEYDAARYAFDRGYRDFIERGNDPRLLQSNSDRSTIYRIHAESTFWATLPQPIHEEIIERLYRLAPREEPAQFAWAAQERQFETSGRTQEAQIWRERARDAQAESFWSSSYTNFERASYVAQFVLIASFFAGVIFFVVLLLRHKLHISHWSGHERFGFLWVALVAWLAAGIQRDVDAANGHFEQLPMMGSLAGPVNAQRLSTLQASPDRDFLIALSHQQSRDPAKAEQLYRQLPDFPESWNNLGVILSESGRKQEAQAAFERALRMDPMLAEAALNAGQAPRSLWTEIHKKYLPDQPMIAPPKSEYMWRAAMGGSKPAFYARILAGPFVNTGDPEDRSPLSVFMLVAVVAFIALLTLVPYRTGKPVAEPWQRLVDLLVPGASPVWRSFGATVLTLFLYFLFQGYFTWHYGTPYYNGILPIPTSAFSVEYGLPNVDESVITGRPGWPWLYLAPSLLFAANFFFVLRERKAAHAK